LTNRPAYQGGKGKCDMEHTKGEWIATRGSHSYPLEITTETKTIAQVEARKTIIETDANARLIAAAPDLLAACEYALPLIIGERLKNDIFPPKKDDLGEYLAGLIETCEKKLEFAIEKTK